MGPAGVDPARSIPGLGPSLGGPEAVVGGAEAARGRKAGEVAGPGVGAGEAPPARGRNDDDVFVIALGFALGFGPKGAANGCA